MGIHVPLGKLKTERMVPVDTSVCTLVQRFDSFAPSILCLPMDGSWRAQAAKMRSFVNSAITCIRSAIRSDLSTRIVPHQFRHTYATEMLRAGVSFPVLMKLLGHTDPEMTMRYVDVALTDLQREFQQARANPKYLVPQPKAVISSTSLRPRWRHRFFARRSTCAGDVPPPATEGRFPRLPRPALQPPHQDPQRSAKNQHTMKNGQRLAG